MLVHDVDHALHEIAVRRVVLRLLLVIVAATAAAAADTLAILPVDSATDAATDDACSSGARDGCLPCLDGRRSRHTQTSVWKQIW